MTDHTLHLRPDELDLLLEGRLRTDRTSHIETCEECRSALDEVRDVVLAAHVFSDSPTERLPLFYE